MAEKIEKSKTSFVFHAEWMAAIQDLPAEKGIILIKIMMDYSCNGVEPAIEDPVIRALFKAFKPRIDSDVESYKESCRRKSEAMKKIWEEREAKKKMEQQGVVGVLYNSIEDHGVAIDTDSDTDSDIDSDTDLFKKEKNKKEKVGTKPKRFVPPTLKEVEDYCRERGNGINAESFINHYEAVGWKRGKSPIKDWKACVRTWEDKEKKEKSKGDELDDYLLKAINGEDKNFMKIL